MGLTFFDKARELTEELEKNTGGKYSSSSKTGGRQHYERRNYSSIW